MARRSIKPVETLGSTEAEIFSGYTQFDNDKLHLDAFHHPNQHRPGSIFTPKRGYFLNEAPKLFDHSFFGNTPTEAITMHPTQRKLLEVTYKAYENAGDYKLEW